MLLANSLVWHVTGKAIMEHAAAAGLVKVCERTWGMLEKGGWEEADWWSAGGEGTPVALLLTPEPICSVVERKSQDWHVTV